MAARIGTSTDMVYDGNNLLVKGDGLTFDGTSLLIKDSEHQTFSFTGDGELNVKVMRDIIGATPVTQDSTANATNTITVVGAAGEKICVTHIALSISGASTTGVQTLLVKDNAVNKFKYVIPTATPMGTVINLSFPTPINITAGDLTVVCSGLGASSISTINLGYFKVNT